MSDIPTPSRRQIRQWRRYLAEERLEADTYRNLARRQRSPHREIMLELAAAEGRHEQYWLELLGDQAYPPPRVPWRRRLMSSLANRFGSVFVLALAQRSEQRTGYDDDHDVPDQMAADEHIHGEVVRSLAAESRAHMAGSFRAAVFGANDGLISNLALILGVAATGMTPSMVLATGVAGLLAGALSMGAGEWISVSSQRELLSASTPDDDAHRSVPALDVNANELALLFRARGESPETAQEHAERVFAALGEAGDSASGQLPLRSALGEGARQTSTEAVGTPFRAAVSSFIFFALGALLPLIPFMFGVGGWMPIVISSVLVGITLLGTGGVVGLLSGGTPWRTALRQLAVGYGAAAVTFALGTLFGATIG